jgi:hypothetical protein
MHTIFFCDLPVEIPIRDQENRYTYIHKLGGPNVFIHNYDCSNRCVYVIHTYNLLDLFVETNIMEYSLSLLDSE